MNKMNKKGFTLIEMLVVIAIIAILVAIIIPTVTAATDKAACATNAANLRSLTAEATTNYLMGGEFKITTQGVKSKSCSLVAGGLDPKVDAQNMIVTFGDVTIAQFAQGAGDKDAVVGGGNGGIVGGGDESSETTTTTQAPATTEHVHNYGLATGGPGNRYHYCDGCTSSVKHSGMCGLGANCPG